MKIHTYNVKAQNNRITGLIGFKEWNTKDMYNKYLIS
jgi:hypothetical protein